MIHTIRSNKRHFSDYHWLQTYWLFSFSDYFDPDNIQFGALRVFNDDVVQPGSGFPTHPHREMEIITLVLEGEMTHQDSMGNRTVIRAGDVQRMSAGTGLTHSEFNRAGTPVHFYQVWILPDIPQLKPSYDQKRFDPSLWQNQLLPVASGQGLPGTVTIHTDATLYRTEMEAGRAISFPVSDQRRVFIYITRGTLDINGKVLQAGDQARVDLESRLDLVAVQKCSLVLIDVPSCKGWGYDQKTLAGSHKQG